MGNAWDWTWPWWAVLAWCSGPDPDQPQWLTMQEPRPWYGHQISPSAHMSPRLTHYVSQMCFLQPRSQVLKRHKPIITYSAGNWYMLRTVYVLYHSMHCTLYYYNDTFLRRLVNTTESANDLKIEKTKQNLSLVTLYLNWKQICAWCTSHSDSEVAKESAKVYIVINILSKRQAQVNTHSSSLTNYHVLHDVDEVSLHKKSMNFAGYSEG